MEESARFIRWDGVGIHVALTVQSPKVTTYITCFEIKKACFCTVHTVHSLYYPRQN